MQLCCNSRAEGSLRAVVVEPPAVRRVSAVAVGRVEPLRAMQVLRQVRECWAQMECLRESPVGLGRQGWLRGRAVQQGWRLEQPRLAWLSF